MTKENSKKLYDHYVSIGNDKAAENMLVKYPEFKGTSKKTKKAEEKVEEEEEQKD